MFKIIIKYILYVSNLINGTIKSIFYSLKIKEIIEDSNCVNISESSNESNESNLSL